MPISVPSLTTRQVGNTIDPEDIAKLIAVAKQLDGAPTGPEWTDAQDEIAYAMEWGNVRKYGARGDIIQDNTTFLQDAIDDAHDRAASGQPYGGIVFMPPGVYASGPLLHRDGVVLYAGGRIMGQGYVYGPVRIIPVTDGPNEVGTGDWLISQENPAVRLMNAGIVGITMEGRDTTNESGGLYFPDTGEFVLSSFFGYHFGMEGLILGGQNARLAYALIQGLRSASYVGGLSSRSGASVIDGVDHQVSHMEFTGPDYEAVSSEDLYAAAAHLLCSHSVFDTTVFQTGDVGLSLAGGQQNRFVGYRIDTNAGHGLIGVGDAVFNTFTGGQFNRNSYAEEDTYDHIHIPSGGVVNNHFHLPFFGDGGKTVRYCIHDQAGNPDFANTYYDPAGQTGDAGFYNVDRSRVLITPGGLRELAGATPSVLNQTTYRTWNFTPTTVTNLLGGVAGQRVTIIGADAANTTIQHNSNLVLIGGADNTLADNEAITLIRAASAWVQV
jgi:hypothetical protein